MRKKLRAKPNHKVSIPKYEKHSENKNNYFPNKEMNPKKDDIHYSQDIHNKNYFYENFRDRLDYNRSHSNLFLLKATHS